MEKPMMAPLVLLLLLPAQAEPVPEPEDVPQIVLDALQLAHDFVQDFNASQSPEAQIDAALAFSQSALDLVRPLICEGSRTAHSTPADAWASFFPPVDYNAQSRILEIKELALEDGEWLVIVHRFRVWTDGVDCSLIPWQGPEVAGIRVNIPGEQVTEVIE